MNERDGAVPGSVLGIARRHLGRLALTLVVSVVMHAGLAAAVWLGGQASGVSLDYITVLFVLTCAWTFQSIPVQFLGIGAAELVATALYTAVGLTPATALFMTSLLVCYRLLMAVTGGAWHAQAILRAQLTAAPRRPCVSVRAAPH